MPIEANSLLLQEYANRGKLFILSADSLVNIFWRTGPYKMQSCNLEEIQLLIISLLGNFPRM